MQQHWHNSNNNNPSQFQGPQAGGAAGHYHHPHNNPHHQHQPPQQAHYGGHGGGHMMNGQTAQYPPQTHEQPQPAKPSWRDAAQRGPPAGQQAYVPPHHHAPQPQAHARTATGTSNSSSGGVSGGLNVGAAAFVPSFASVAKGTSSSLNIGAAVFVPGGGAGGAARLATAPAAPTTVTSPVVPLSLVRHQAATATVPADCAQKGVAVIVLGPRGSGKTTQCKRLAAAFGLLYVHLSVLQSSELSAYPHPIMAMGAFIKKALGTTTATAAEGGTRYNGVVIDRFLSDNASQVLYLDRILADCGLKVNIVLHITSDPPALCLERAQARQDKKPVTETALQAETYLLNKALTDYYNQRRLVYSNGNGTEHYCGPSIVHDVVFDATATESGIERTLHNVLKWHVPSLVAASTNNNNGGIRFTPMEAPVQVHVTKDVHKAFLAALVAAGKKDPAGDSMALRCSGDRAAAVNVPLFVTRASPSHPAAVLVAGPMRVVLNQRNITRYLAQRPTLEHTNGQCVFVDQFSHFFAVRQQLLHLCAGAPYPPKPGDAPSPPTRFPGSAMAGLCDGRLLSTHTRSRPVAEALATLKADGHRLLLCRYLTADPADPTGARKRVKYYGFNTVFHYMFDLTEFLSTCPQLPLDLSEGTSPSDLVYACADDLHDAVPGVCDGTIDMVLDCEVFNHPTPTTGDGPAAASHPRIAVFDFLVLFGTCAQKVTFPIRHRMLRQLFHHRALPTLRTALSAEEAAAMDALADSAEFAIEHNANAKLFLKRYVPTADLDRLLPDGYDRPPFPIDGVIFQHKGVYRAGKDNMIFKWKPAELNTADFRLVRDVTDFVRRSAEGKAAFAAPPPPQAGHAAAASAGGPTSSAHTTARLTDRDRYFVGALLEENNTERPFCIIHVPASVAAHDARVGSVVETLQLTTPAPTAAIEEMLRASPTGQHAFPPSHTMPTSPHSPTDNVAAGSVIDFNGFFWTYERARPEKPTPNRRKVVTEIVAVQPVTFAYIVKLLGKRE